jgi:rubrerythrin
MAKQDSKFDSILKTISLIRTYSDSFQWNSDLFERFVYNTDPVEQTKKSSKTFEAEERKNRKTLIIRIERFTKRLEVFFETGCWESRKHVKITDDDDSLQKLLISLNKEFVGIESLVEKYKEIKIETLKVLFEKCIDKIRQELKFRQTRREKRKIAFILDS